MNTFFDPVNNTAAVEQLNKELGKDGGRTVLISGCIDTQKVHISSAIASGYKYMLIVTSDEAKARKMCDDASFLIKKQYTIQPRMPYSIVRTYTATRLQARD